MVNRNKLFTYFSGFLLLMLFIEHICSITLFVHQHNIDGQIITHSHITYNATGEASHTHTTKQLEVIEQLATFVALAATLCVFGVLVHNLPNREVIFYISHLGKTSIQHFNLRAPPAL